MWGFPLSVICLLIFLSDALSQGPQFLDEVFLTLFFVLHRFFEFYPDSKQGKYGRGK